MFRKKETLLFILPRKSRVGLHMFGVFFTIDVFFLDEDGVVIERTMLRPLRGYRARRAARYFIETPRGQMGEVEIGQRFSWQGLNRRALSSRL